MAWERGVVSLELLGGAGVVLGEDCREVAGKRTKSRWQRRVGVWWLCGGGAGKSGAEWWGIIFD